MLQCLLQRNTLGVGQGGYLQAELQGSGKLHVAVKLLLLHGRQGYAAGGSVVGTGTGPGGMLSSSRWLVHGGKALLAMGWGVSCTHNSEPGNSAALLARVRGACTHVGRLCVHVRTVAQRPGRALGCGHLAPRPPAIH